MEIENAQQTGGEAMKVTPRAWLVTQGFSYATGETFFLALRSLWQIISKKDVAATVNVVVRGFDCDVSELEIGKGGFKAPPGTDWVEFKFENMKVREEEAA